MFYFTKRLVKRRTNIKPSFRKWNISLSPGIEGMTVLL